MTEKKLEELTAKSQSTEGAKKASAALRVYLSAKKKWDELKECWLASLKVGDIVNYKGNLYPREIIEIDGNKFRLKVLFNGEIEDSRASNIAPYDEMDAYKALLRERLILVGKQLDTIISNKDEFTFRAIEQLLKDIAA
jgi:hypothetical protein